MKEYILLHFPDFEENYELYFVTWFFQSFHNPSTIEVIDNATWLGMTQKVGDKELKGPAKMVAIYGGSEVSTVGSLRKKCGRLF
ncbi:hypothetical protein ACFLTA_07915 [Bacteroidota bacterium]